MRYKYVYTILLLVILHSCGGVHDESSDGDSLNSEIVQQLNAKNISSAEKLIEEGKTKYPDSLLLKYYEAQLLSLKADVDIYALFPIVKMELFEFALTEWSRVDEFSKRSRTDVEDTLLGDSVDPRSTQDLEQFYKDFSLLDPTKIEYVYESKTHSDMYGYINEPYISDYERDEYGDLIYDEEGNQVPIYSIYCGNYYFVSLADFNFNVQVSDYRYETIQGKTCPEIDYEIDPRFMFRKFKSEIKALIDKKKDRQQNKKYLKAALALYESVGIISKVPKFERENLDDLLKAVDFLKVIVESGVEGERLYDNAKKQLGLLGGFLILSSIKRAIPVNKIDEPTDFLCKANPKKLFEQGPILFEGLKVLLYILKDTEFEKKNKKSLAKIREKVDHAEDEGIFYYFESKQAEDDFIKGHQDLVEKNCVL